MKKNNPFKSGNTLVVLSVCICSALIGACSDKMVRKETISEAESCKRLQAVIEDHPNQFKKYKNHFRIHTSHNSWTAEKVLTSARECQVWEWSTGLFNYFCEWEAEDGEVQALANYQEASRVIKNCLGEPWSVEINTTRTGGESMVFSNANLPTIVNIRYFIDSKGWFNNWYNTIIIGDKSNLKTPLL